MKVVIYQDSKGREKTLKVAKVRTQGWFLADDGRAYWISPYRTQIYREWGESMRRIGTDLIIAG